MLDDMSRPNKMWNNNTSTKAKHGDNAHVYQGLNVTTIVNSKSLIKEETQENTRRTKKYR